MSKPELGHKRTCTACAVRFYDLARSPAICPKCGAAQPPPAPRIAARGRIAPVRWSSRQEPTPVVHEEPFAVAVVEPPEEAVDEEETPPDDEDEITPDVEEV